jgi:hypothetical protein
MIKKILTLVLTAAIILLAPSFALADDSQIFAICKTNPNASICPNKGTTKDPVIHVINVAAGLIAVIAGIAAVILIIVSGIAMITSSGNQEAVKNARRRLAAAIIGLVFIALAWTIVSFATTKLIK